MKTLKFILIPTLIIAAIAVVASTLWIQKQNPVTKHSSAIKIESQSQGQGINAGE